METTTEHFKIFKDEVIRLQKVWGLVSWEIEFSHKELSDDTVSQVVADPTPRTAVFMLNTDPPNEFSIEELKDSCLHEVLELLLLKLRYLVCDTKDEEAREEVHAIIQTIINVNKNRGIYVRHN